MIYALLGLSIGFLFIEAIGFASAVQYTIDLGKFTHKKQKISLNIAVRYNARKRKWRILNARFSNLDLFIAIGYNISTRYA